MRQVEQRVVDSYGFLPDLSRSTHRDSQRVLGDTPSGFYFNSPSNLAFHDLTTGKSLPAATRVVMGLSTKFVPVPRHPPSRKRVMEAFERFEREVNRKAHFAGKEDTEYIKSKLLVRSKYHPFSTVEVDSRLYKFEIELRRLFYKRTGRSNFTTFQEKIFQRLREDDSIVFALADKGLGPVAVNLDRYIRDALVHLQDSETYEIISEEQALEEIRELHKTIWDWTAKYFGSPKVKQKHIDYIRKKLEETEDEPFGYFYLLYKLHKSPIKTRPVCSDCASLPHALGQWVDEMLQPIVKAQHTYFRDSFVLKRELDQLKLPANASILSFDAVSMYTKIDIDDCIARLSTFLLDPQTQAQFPHYDADALIEAIEIVMRNNRMRFGDIIVKQLIGVAMGMSPAPPIANLYVAIHEKESILSFLDSCILYLKRFIDDGLAIWLHDPDPAVDAANWIRFKQAICAGGLQWTFTKRDTKVDFMDMTISIAGNKIETTLFEKPLALHLYIPPHSCHPPGVATGLIMSKVLRIFYLCSKSEDIEAKLKQFYGELRDRGYQEKFINPVFDRAIANSKRYLSQTEAYRQQIKAQKEELGKRRVFFHIQYHPANPSSRELQQLWNRTVFCPPGKPQLNQLTNQRRALVPVDRMVIAYSRAPNIGNLLSYRKICKRSGPKVSSYL